jgi:DNA-binding beta-propeller fold protein YncE
MRGAVGKGSLTRLGEVEVGLEPVAVAVAPGGSTIYAAALHSGNRTTTIHPHLVGTSYGMSPFPAGA